METGFSVDLRYYYFSEELQPYFTALYLFNIVTPDGEEIADWLHPEWAAMRFTTSGTPPASAIGGLEALKRRTPFVVSGATSKAVHFSLATSQIWGLGLQPAGWGQFVAGQASDFSDRIVDGFAEPAFATFAPILRMVQNPQVSPDLMAEMINAYLLSRLGQGEVRVELIRRVHDALRNPEVSHVADFSERVGLGRRSLERICLRYFGFPPKLLLRRQRFLRSLARYMLDPGRNWSNALDPQYHDQAQFVRDFHAFMGMTPTEYADRPHPILNRILGQRMADLGAAPETDLPTLLRYRLDAGNAGEQEQPRQRGGLIANRGLGVANGPATGAPMITTDELDRLASEARARIAAAATLDELEAARIAYLGKQGSVSALLKTLGGMSPEERQQKAPAIQALRQTVTDELADRRAAMESAVLEQRLAAETLDLSLPALETPQGSVHPVSQVMDELAEIFADLGFSVATGPEIEDDWYNFTALNMPESHPARAMHDTFYFPDAAPKGGRMLLRTHTSPVQVRTMIRQGAPLRIIAPGRVYRSDSDATHTPMFHQVEGLVIDRNIHLGHLKWTLETFLKAFFEREDIVLRLRPSYFPFTEPSVEVDVGFAIDNGRRVLGGSGDEPGHGWMELLGSGMVNRRVIEMSGLDPDEWQGFAFGVGVDRLAMLKYGMDDLRAFFDGDVRWLRHYGFSAFDQPTLSAGVGARA